MANDDTWVIIPAYNEVAVIAHVVADLHATFRNIVCVDDASTDGSAAQIATHLVRHPINLRDDLNLRLDHGDLGNSARMLLR